MTAYKQKGEISNATSILSRPTVIFKNYSQRTAPLTLYGHIKTTEKYGDWYTGRWWVGCYIWYSEEGPGRAWAPPSPLLAVPNVTAHPSTASVPTSYHLTWPLNSKGLRNCVTQTTRLNYTTERCPSQRCLKRRRDAWNHEQLPWTTAPCKANGQRVSFRN